MSTHVSEEDARNADILIRVDGQLEARRWATVSLENAPYAGSAP